MHTTSIGYQPLIEMSASSLSRLQAAIKRAFDMVVADFVHLVDAPLMSIIALLVKLEDRGPVLFKQRRVGRDGEIFEILKFRTMVVDAEARLERLRTANERHGPLFKLEHDPRITWIGRFLRATSLDE